MKSEDAEGKDETAKVEESEAASKEKTEEVRIAEIH